MAAAAPLGVMTGPGSGTSPTLPDPGRHAGGQDGTQDDPDDGTRRPDDEGLDEDERGELTAGRARGAEQAELADPFHDGHRERVEDEERPGEQGDRGDQGGRGREVTGRGAQRRRRDRAVTTGRRAP